MTTKQLSKEQRATLRSCIFKGVAIVLGVTTLIVALTLYVPEMNKVAKHPFFVKFACILSIVGIVMIFARIIIHSHVFQRITFGVVFLAMTGLMMAISAYATPSVVISSLVSALIIVSIMSVIGGRIDADLKSWGTPLFAALFVLLIAGILNTYVFEAGWLEKVIAAIGVLVFSIYTIHDVNQFSRGNICIHDCCEEGTFHVWLNFVNVFMELVTLLE